MNKVVFCFLKDCIYGCDRAEVEMNWVEVLRHMMLDVAGPSNPTLL